jgi:phage shock protein A
MGVMKRMSGILQAKTNKLLDKAEDPRESLDLSYQKLLENLQKVRRSVADVTTAKKRIELQATQLQGQADKLQQQAKDALSQNREDLARRAAIAPQLADLQTQHQQVADQETKLIATAQNLQAQVDAFRTKKETMKATYTAAEAQTKIGEAVSGISESMGDAGMSVQRAQDKIDSMQARAGAMDELLSSGALTDLANPVDDIQAQLDQVSSASSVDADLAALKAEIGTGAGAPAQLGPAEEAAPAAEAESPK